MTAVQWVVSALGGFGGLAGIAALVNAITGRGKTRAEAAQILTGTAVALVNELEEAARVARAAEATSRAELQTARDEMRGELQAVRDEARLLAGELHHLRTAILQPTATIEGVRAIVLGGGSNGRRI